MSLTLPSTLLPTIGQVISYVQHPHWLWKLPPFPLTPFPSDHHVNCLTLRIVCRQATVNFIFIYSPSKSPFPVYEVGRRGAQARPEHSAQECSSLLEDVGSTSTPVFFLPWPVQDPSLTLPLPWALGCAPSQTFSQVPHYCVAWAWRDSCGPKGSLRCHVLLLKFMWRFQFTP